MLSSGFAVFVSPALVHPNEPSEVKLATSSGGSDIFFSLTPTTGNFCCPFVLACALFILYFNPGDVRDYAFLSVHEDQGD